MGNPVALDARYQRGVVSFGASRGEKNLRGTGVEQFRNLLSCFLNGRPHFPSTAVDRRWITKMSLHIGQHGFDHPIVHRCSGGIIKVNFHAGVFLFLKATWNIAWLISIPLTETGEVLDFIIFGYVLCNNSVIKSVTR